MTRKKAYKQPIISDLSEIVSPELLKTFGMATNAGYMSICLVISESILERLNRCESDMILLDAEHGLPLALLLIREKAVVDFYERKHESD